MQGLMLRGLCGILGKLHAWCFRPDANLWPTSLNRSLICSIPVQAWGPVTVCTIGIVLVLLIALANRLSSAASALAGGFANHTRG